MTTVAARVSRHRQLGYFQHTSVDGETWTLQHRGVTDGAGAAGGTTLDASTKASGVADTYNGRYWVRMLSGLNTGLWKRVIDDDGAGLLTFENNGFPNQVLTAMEYELWKSPEPVVVVDSSSGETNMVDALRTDTAETWEGYYAIPITGARRGRIARVTSSSAVGVYVLAAGLGGALAAGDVVVLRKFLEVSDPAGAFEQAYEPTMQDRLDGAIGDGVVTAKGGTFGFSSEIYGSGSQVAADANPSVLSGLFQGCGFKEEIGGTNTVGAGSTTEAIAVVVDSGAENPPGTMLVYDGHATFVTSVVDDGGGAGTDTVNVSPPLPIAPVSGEVIYGARTYRRNRQAEDGDYCGVGFELEVDGVRHIVTGCRGNLTLEDGARPTFSWQFSIDHWVREIERAPYYAGGAYTTVPPVLSSDRICYIDSTKTDVGQLTASLNNEVAPKLVQGSNGINGRAGYAHARANPGASFRELLDSTLELPQDERYQSRTAFAFTAIYGAGSDNIMALRIPVARHVETPTPADASGMIDVPDVVRAQDAGTGVNVAGTLVRLPDFVIGLA